MRITQKVNAVIMLKSTGYYFYMKTKTSEDFHICINVPLKRLITLGSTEYTVLLTDQIFITLFNETLGQVLVLKHRTNLFKRLAELFKN